MSQLPSGFVLDEPPSGAQSPDGFVLDDPAPRSSALPEGYTLDQPANSRDPTYYPSRKPSAVKRNEPDVVASPGPTPYKLPPISQAELRGGPYRDSIPVAPDMPDQTSGVSQNAMATATMELPREPEAATPAPPPLNILDQSIRGRELDVQRLEQAKQRGEIIENKGGFWAQIRQGLTGEGDALSPVSRPWSEKDQQELDNAKEALSGLQRQRDNPTKFERFAGAAAETVVPPFLRGDAKWVTANPKDFGDKLTQIVGGISGIPLAFMGPRAAAMELSGTALGQNILTFGIHGQAYMPSDSGVGERVAQLGKDAALGVVFSGLSQVEKLGATGKVLAPAGMFSVGYGMAKAEGATDEDAILSGSVMLYLHYAGKVGEKLDQISAHREAKTQLRKELTDRFGNESAERIIQRADAEVNRILQETPAGNLTGSQRQDYANWVRQTGIEDAMKAERLHNVTLAERAEVQYIKSLAKQGDADARRWLEWKAGVRDTTGTPEPPTPWRVGTNQGAMRARDTVRLLAEQAGIQTPSAVPAPGEQTKDFPAGQPGATASIQTAKPALPGQPQVSEPAPIVVPPVTPSIAGQGATEIITGSGAPGPAPSSNANASPPESAVPEITSPTGTSQLDPKRWAITEIPLERITLSKDVPNFKEDANPETGEVRGKELKGAFDRRGTGPIILWKRNNGTLEVISGRHRLALARRAGEQTIPAQIVKEAEGFDINQAMTLDAELNIRDGMGTTRDYASYFRTTEQTIEQARQANLLRDAKGEAGWYIGKGAGDDLYTAYRNEAISEAKVVAIAKGAPGDVAVQSAAMAKANSKNAPELEQYARALTIMPKAQNMAQDDLFGFDDSVLKEAELLAKTAAQQIRAALDTERSIRQAINRGEKLQLTDAQARALGIEDKTNRDQLTAALQRTVNQRMRLDQWDTDPTVMNEIRAAAGLPSRNVPPQPTATPSANAASLLPSPITRGINPRTGQTELLGQEEGGFKLVGQDDPSAAARQAKADAEALAKAQAELDARQGRLFGVDPASDIKGAAVEQSRGGFIRTPSSRAVRAIGTKIRQLLLPHRGVGNQVYDLWVWSEAQKDAVTVAGRADYERLEGILSEVKQRVSRAQAQQIIREFQDGIKTLPDVEAALGLPPNGPVSQVLKAVESSNRARQQLLAGWPGLSENLRQHILDNVYYQTRAYLKHALGPDFVPQASAIQDATTAIKNDLIDQLDKFDKRATSVRGKRGQVDVVNWLYTGDPQYLAGVSPTRRAAAEGLREQYLNLQHLITGLQQNNNVVTAVRNVNAMGRAAEDVVEFYLSREAPGKGGAQGGIKIANLQHRMLDIAFRKLYGEILDPAMRQRITSEVQGKMLAQMTFFNRVIQEAEGIVWARYADQERGFMYRLGDVQSPSDIKRYGDLNGMYVNKEFYDLINSQKVHDDNVRKVIDALWFVPMSVQRGAKLINPRTIFRNYYTAVLGFAQGSGDAYLPGYWTAFWKAHGLAIRYARGDVKALEEIQSLYSMNVARVGQNSAVYDLQTSLTGMTGKIGKLGRNVMTAYTFIDFPSKYAAFEARRQYFEQRGMSPDEAAAAAAQHVQDLYQNQDRIPEVIRKVTKAGVADYFGYFYDSVRIMGNQFKWAARSMTDYKDPRPMIGLFASRALLLAAGLVMNEFFTNIFSKMHESLRKYWDKQEDRGQKPLSSDRTDAMREFMRDFDKNMPLMAWEERGADGKEYVYVTMLSGQSAFPLEDALLGAMTSSATGEEFFKGLGNNLWQSVDPGMYINTWSRLLAGQDLNKQRTPTGMGLYQILVNKEDPDRSAALQDLFFELGKDFAPLGIGPALERINQIKERERAGQNNETWFQRTTTVDDAKASALRLIRTSRIEQSDMNWMVRETARPYVEAIKKNKSKINLPIKEQVTKGGATETQLAEAEKARSSLIQNRGELVKIARAAHKVNAKWYDQTNLFLTLTGAGIDGPMADSIVREAIYGTPSSEYEYVPNPSFRPTDVLQPDKEMGIYENRQRMRINEP